MLLGHPEHPGRRVRLGYCLNLHAADDLEQALEGMRGITLPLAERLAGERAFGVGLYLPAALALHLGSAAGRDDLERLGAFLAEHRLDPFTANAFPYGGFHRSGLKRDVFRPTWADPERLAFTLAVGRALEDLAIMAGDGGARRGHLSLSTHAGLFGSFASAGADARSACALGLSRAALGLARLEERSGLRVVLAVEAEPRSCANDTRELAAWLEEVRRRGPALVSAADGEGEDEVARALERSLGACLDACHSAVELEEPAEAVELATRAGLGKLQFSSALRLDAPGRRRGGRERLLALDEPRYLHQVTGRRGEAGSGPAGALRADDLPELAAELAREPAGWLDCAEWRCHFHVPVDLSDLGGELGTTTAHADRILGLLLADPARWGGPELHVELETYTWDVLPRAARGAGELVDGLEREVRHVLARLSDAGWSPAP